MPAPSSKRRKLDPRKHGVEELHFDPAARQDYLSGFHRRKQQRLKQAAEIAVRRAREQQVADRKALRERRKADLAAHVQTVKAMMAKAERGAMDSSDDEEEDDKGDVDEGHQEEEEMQEDGEAEEDEVEYIDEDKYTTVTIGPLDEAAESGDDDEEKADEENEDDEDNRGNKAIPTKVKPSQQHKVQKQKPQVKKKKFRYESPAQRKAARGKQAKRNSEAARARKGSKR